MALKVPDQAKLAFLQAGLDHIDQGISVFDDQMRLVFWNRRFFDLLEFPPEFAEVGRPFEDFVRCNVERGEYGPGDSERQMEERLARARRFSAHYLERARPNGVILAIHGVPLPDGGFITVYTDITEQKESERLIQERNEELERRVQERTQALKLSQDRLQLITDAVPAGIAYVDAEERYRFANQRIARAFGFSKEEILGKSVEEVLGAELAGQVQPYLDLARRGEEVAFEYASGLPGGRQADIRTTLLPELDQAGAVKGTYVLSLNVSDQKKAEAALAQAQKMEAVAELSGGLAHDFNNLLTVVLGNLLPLKETGGLGRQELELLEPAIEATRRGASLIRRLLAFSRRDPLEPVSVDVGRLTEGLVGLLRSSLPDSIEIDPATPDEPLYAFVDPLRLENAVLNLVFNARDAMPEGGRLAIAVAPERVEEPAGSSLDLSPGDYVKITVADSGSGIDPETLARVFEPFFTTKAQGSGTGLGLSMVYGFAKQSDGAAGIESVPGEGTVVSLFIPSAEEPAAGGSVLEEGDGELAEARQLVLLVDDDEDVRRVVRRQLKELGYPTLEASDGEAALELLGAVEDIAILLSDVVMPGGMNGFELAERARATLPDLQVFLMSAHAKAERPQMDNGRRVPLLRKPFETRQLDEFLRQGSPVGTN